MVFQIQETPLSTTTGERVEGAMTNKSSYWYCGNHPYSHKHNDSTILVSFKATITTFAPLNSLRYEELPDRVTAGLHRVHYALALLVVE